MQKVRTHVVVEEGAAIKVCESEQAVTSALAASKRSAATGVPVPAKHMGIQALVRARMAERGITVDSILDTLEDARTSASNRLGDPDHRVRIEAAKIEATMSGLMGEVKGQQEEKPASAATFTQAELKGRSSDEIIAMTLRKLHVAQSKGQLKEDDIEIRPEQVESLSRFSQAAIGNVVEGDISLRTRPGSKVHSSEFDFAVEGFITKEEVQAELITEGELE